MYKHLHLLKLMYHEGYAAEVPYGVVLPDSLAERKMDMDCLQYASGRHRFTRTCGGNGISPRAAIGFVLAAILVVLGEGRVLQAQIAVAPVRSYPNQIYFQSFGYFNRGDFARALKSYRSAARGGLRSTENRWVDSVCYYTMIGECHYQLGNFALALKSYDSALALVADYPDWMLRVDFPPTIQASQRADRRNITWGPSARNALLGRFGDRYAVLFGRLRNEDVIRQGGVVAPPEYYQVYVHEIVRCTALSLRRRKELLGPVCRFDVLTQRMIRALSGRIGPVNHWSTPWTQIQLALAHLGADQFGEATILMEKSLSVMGRFDHPLTATALVELGKLHRDQGRYEQALQHFFEATLAAAEFAQADLVREAFQLAGRAHLATHPENAYAPLIPAVTWAKRNNFDFLQASLLADIADQLIALGQHEQSQQPLAEAGRIIKRRNISSVALAARVGYLSAVVAIEQNKQKFGIERLHSALQLQAAVSPPLFQLQSVDGLYTSGTITPRNADTLYAELLDDPGDDDWAVDPLGSLAFLIAPRESFLENWFEIAVRAKQTQESIEVSERIKRNRFLREHSLGGRLFALQWILEGPPQLLSERALRQRQDLLQAHPYYQEISGQVAGLLDEIKSEDLVTNDADLALKQRKRFDRLSELSATLEYHLLRLAVGRAPSEIVFPPLLKTEDIQAQLAEDELAIIFHQTSRRLQAFMVSRDKQASWEVKRPGRLKSQLTSVLRSMGLVDADRPVTLKQLADESWKKQSQTLGRMVFADKQQGFWNQFERLTIVPDGFLWYLPFESIQITNDPGTTSLLSRIAVRYAPTLGLSTPDRRGFQPNPRRLAIVDQLHPKENVELVRDQFDQLNQIAGGFQELSGRLPTTSNNLASVIDDLLVLDDIKKNQLRPLQWSLISAPSSNQGETLQSWYAVPWGGPRTVVMPGFHTAAERGLKKMSDGGDLFHATIGLIANGSRTALISRWRNGGQTTYDLLHEFYQELPHTSPAKSWKRAVEVVGANEINPEFEPRVTAGTSPLPILASHPFLSSNFLLMDRSPERDTGENEVDTARLPPDQPAAGR